MSVDRLGLADSLDLQLSRQKAEIGHSEVANYPIDFVLWELAYYRLMLAAHLGLSRLSILHLIEKQPLEYYLNLQYPVTLYPDPEGGCVAQIKDLPGCLTQGETLDEAIANIQEAWELWIETAYEAGDEIPLPSTDDTYSGKLLLRMPKSLHRRLAEKADRENVSLNQYIVSVLSRG